MTSRTGLRTLYVSDLDGTLLGSDGAVSVESQRLLNAAIDAGAMFTYATARSFLRSRKATAGLRLDLPVITYGGTITTDPDDGEPIDVVLLDRTTIEAAIEACAAAPAAEPIFHVFDGGRDWVRWRPECTTTGVRRFLNARPGDPRLRPITADDPLDRSTVFYVAVLAENPTLVDLRDALLPRFAGVAHFLSEDMYTPGLDWLEFHNDEGTKAKAIRRLMRQIGAERLVVFGDNHNDLPMFDIADESYAVANAVPAVANAATGVIGSNDDHAVARWIAADVGAQVVE